MRFPIPPSFSRSGGRSTQAVRITSGDPLWGARGLKMDRAITEASYTSREPGPELLPSLGIASPLDQSSARCLGPRRTGWSAGTAGISRWVALQLLRPQRVCNQQSCGIWDLFPALAPGRSAVLRMLLAAHRWQWAFTISQREPKLLLSLLVFVGIPLTALLEVLRSGFQGAPRQRTVLLSPLCNVVI